jgi:hypothetical protein
MMKIAGSGSGSIGQRHGSAVPDPNLHHKGHGSATLLKIDSELKERFGGIIYSSICICSICSSRPFLSQVPYKLISLHRFPLLTPKTIE